MKITDEGDIQKVK